MILKKGYNDVPYPLEDEKPDPENSAPKMDPNEGLEHGLKRKLFEMIEVSTHFGTYTGTLVAVKEDYLVLVDATGSVLLIPYSNIEFVSYV